MAKAIPRAAFSILVALLLASGGQGILLGPATPAHAAAIQQEKPDKPPIRAPWLGLSVAPLSEPATRGSGSSALEGLLVLDLVPGGPAHTGGLRPADVITAVDGQTMQDTRHLESTLQGRRPGDSLQAAVLRGDQRLTFALKVGARPLLEPQPLVLQPAQPATAAPQPAVQQRGNSGRFSVLDGAGQPLILAFVYGEVVSRDEAALTITAKEGGQHRSYKAPGDERVREQLARLSPGDEVVVLSREAAPDFLSVMVTRARPLLGGPTLSSAKDAPAQQAQTAEVAKRAGMGGSVDPEALRQEWLRLSGITLAQTPDRYWKDPFLIPVSGRVTSPFGADRSAEGLPAGPHSGVDIGVPMGTPIRASNAGIVVAAETWQVRGNAIIIDHGHGLYSGYYHLSEFRVSPGQQVARGQVIGLAGSTGLSTGPHLHWEMVFNGRSTQPFMWITPGDGGTALVQELPATPAEVSQAEAGTGGPTEPATLAASAPTTPAAPPAPSPTPPPAPAGPDPARLAAVRQIYQEMLGRDPLGSDDAGLRAWAGSAYGLDELRPRLAAAGAKERAAVVSGWYLQFLGRAHDAAGLASWVDSGLPLADIRERLLSAGRTERRDAIRRLYVELLGRDPLGRDDVSLYTLTDSGLALDEMRRLIKASPEFKARR